jgi:hypothetical protein
MVQIDDKSSNTSRFQTTSGGRGKNKVAMVGAYDLMGGSPRLAHIISTGALLGAHLYAREPTKYGLCSGLLCCLLKCGGFFTPNTEGKRKAGRWETQSSTCCSGE